MFSNKKFAFTLAEVMVTMSIVGVEIGRAHV